MIIESFVDPYNKNILQKDNDGNLYYQNKKTMHLYKNYGGIYDLVLEKIDITKERGFYDEYYSLEQSSNLRQDLLRCDWDEEIFPWRKTFLESLGDIRGKKILILGCGESVKEFYFLTLGTKVIFTDLSLEAVKYMRKIFN